MPEPGPTRTASDLADVVELLLDKGVVVNADIAVTVGETELLGVHVKAAIASFETAAKYGLQFPEGTDEKRLRQAAGVPPGEASLDEDDGAESAEESDETDGQTYGTRSPTDPESPDKLAVRPYAVPEGEADAEGTRGAAGGAVEGVREAVGGTQGEAEEPAEADEPEGDEREASGDENEGPGAADSDETEEGDDQD